MQDCIGIRLDRSNETILCAGDLEDCLIDREVLGISTPARIDIGLLNPVVDGSSGI